MKDEIEKVEDGKDFSHIEIAKNAGRQTLKGFKIFSIVVFSFTLVNIAFIIYDSSHTENFVYPKYAILGAILIALFFLVMALFRTYQFILVDSLGLIYNEIVPFLKKVCTTVIDKVVEGGNKLSGKDINKSINVGALMLEVYGNKIPKYVKKGLIFIIAQIPFGDFLTQMQSDLSQQKSSKVLSEILYDQLHGYMTSFFNNNSMNGVFVLLAINVLIQLLISIFL